VAVAVCVPLAPLTFSGLVVLSSSVHHIQEGDWVLIHVGFALAKIDEQEARASLALLEELGQAYSDELKAFGDSQIE
jgi:hydrogenase assembly chaperone HypC/HupF